MNRLPAELVYRLSGNLEYIDIQSFNIVSQYYNNLFGDLQFWESKIFQDFNIGGEEYKEIVQETKSSKKAYMRIAANHNIPFIGAEKYGNIYELSRQAAWGNNLSLIKYFYQRNKNSQVLFILGKRNKRDWLCQISPQYERSSPILEGALAGGHWELAQSLIDKFGEKILKGSDLSLAIESGNIEIVKSVLTLLHNNYSQLIKNGDITKADKQSCLRQDMLSGLSKAVKHGYYDIIEILLQLGAEGLANTIYQAAKNGDMHMIQYIISQSIDIDWNGGLEGAAYGGFRNIIDFMIDKGATNIDKGIDSAALGGHMDIIKYLVTLGGNISPKTLTSAIRGEHLQIIEYLLSGNLPIGLNFIETAILQDNPDVFSLLMGKVNVNEMMLILMVNNAVKFGRGKVLHKILRLYYPFIKEVLNSKNAHSVTLASLLTTKDDILPHIAAQLADFNALVKPSY